MESPSGRYRNPAAELRPARVRLARPARAWRVAGVLAALLLPPTAGGCAGGAASDPIGDAWSIQGSWLIDERPPSEASCAALGVVYVRVRFVGLSRTTDHPRLVFPCADGAFDTRPEPVVASGTWNIALVAIDAAGNAIATSPPRAFEPIDVRGHLDLGTARFGPSSDASSDGGSGAP